MTVSETIEMLKDQHNRTAVIKTLMVAASALMALAVLTLWLYLAGFNAKATAALRAAAAIGPVTFTEADAQAVRATREPRSAAAGEAAKEAAPRQGAGENEGRDERRGEHSREEGRGPRQEGQGGGGGRGPLSEEFAQLIETHPLFGAPPRSGPPQAKVQGILGEQALINGQWIKVGDTQNGIKLVQTLPDKVIVEIAGKQSEASVWANLPVSPAPQMAPALMQGMGMGGGRPGGYNEWRGSRRSGLGSTLSSLRESLRARRNAMGNYSERPSSYGGSRRLDRDAQMFFQGDAGGQMFKPGKGQKGQKIYQGPAESGAPSGVINVPGGNDTSGLAKKIRRYRSSPGDVNGPGASPGRGSENDSPRPRRIRRTDSTQGSGGSEAGSSPRFSRKYSEGNNPESGGGRRKKVESPSEGKAPSAKGGEDRPRNRKAKNIYRQ